MLPLIRRSSMEGKKPFHFVLNHSKVLVANLYLILYSQLHLEKEIEQNLDLN